MKDIARGKNFVVELAEILGLSDVPIRSLTVRAEVAGLVEVDVVTVAEGGPANEVADVLRRYHLIERPEPEDD